MQPERFTAHAVTLLPLGTRSPIPPSVEPVDIRIDRWSTEAEREEVVKALVSGGQKAVGRVLEKIKPPVGYLYLPGAWPRPDPESVDAGVPRQPLKYAWQTRAENGERRIVLATTYPSNWFTVYEIRFAQNGIGEGRTGRIGVSKNQRTIELTAYKEAQICWRDVRRR